MTDLRYALRSLARAPGFCAAAVLTLALGIGLNTAVLSAAYGILLRPLDLPEPERLYSVTQNMEKRGGGREEPTGFGLFSDWRARNGAFERLAVYATYTADVSSLNPPESFSGAWVSHELFSVLGVEPALGRGFLREEETKGRRNVAILSHGLWSSRFGADPKIVGRAITINGEPHAVVGVLPRGFHPPVTPDAEVWVPAPVEPPPNDRGYSYVHAFGRLRAGVSPAAAQTEMDRVTASLAKEYPDRLENVGATLVPLRDAIAGRARTPLLLLLGAAALVLLVACVNVGSLGLTRAAGRRAELALRIALGATRARIVRLFVLESVLLAAGGAILGYLFGALAVTWLRGLAPPQTPRLGSVHLEGAALAGSFAVALLVSLAAGLLPLLWSWRHPPFDALREGPGTMSGRATLASRGLLVVVEVAASLVLLAGAGILSRTLAALYRVDPGFQTERTAVGNLLLPLSSYPEDRDVMSFHKLLEHRLEQRPEIAAAGLVSPPPLGGEAFAAQILCEGSGAAGTDLPTARFRMATPGFFRAVGLPLRAGRLFTEADLLPDATPVVLISEEFGRRYCGGKDPIGRRIRLPDTGGFGAEGPWIAIVGVVADFRGATLDRPPEPELFVPMGATPFVLRELSVVARARASAATALRALQEAAHEAHPGQVVSRRQTLQEIIGASLSPRRFAAGLTATFAVTALALAAVGIYGVTALAASQRRREIAVRLALGAPPSTIIGMLLRWTATLVAAGTLAGLAGAFALRKTVSGFVYGIQPLDGPTLAASVVILAACAFLATLPLALRAGRTDASKALKSGGQ